MDTNPGPIEPFFFGGHGHFELIVESGLGIYAAGGSIISKMTKIQESKFFLHAHQNVSNLKYIPTVMTLSRLVTVIGECRPMSVVGICRRPVIRVELSQGAHRPPCSRSARSPYLNHGAPHRQTDLSKTTPGEKPKP